MIFEKDEELNSISERIVKKIRAKSPNERRFLAFVKRPIEIQAFRMTKERRWDNLLWPAWLGFAWCLGKDRLGSMYPYEGESCDKKPDHLIINTAEGSMEVSPGDWIIKGVNGELYPCKDDVFRKTYQRPDGYEWRYAE